MVSLRKGAIHNLRNFESGYLTLKILRSVKTFDTGKLSSIKSE